MSDVLITPASSKIEFKDTSNNIDGIIELDASGNLKITAPNAGISLGDTVSDIYIGDGVNNIDIVFEQNGEIRALTGKTLTLGQSDSNVTLTGSITNSGTFTSYFNSNTPGSNLRFGRSSAQYYTFHGGSSGNYLTSISSSGNPKANLLFAYSVDGGATIANQYTLNGNSGTIWHTGNDGSGSGLDADLWDGNQFSSYLNQAVLTGSSPSFNQVLLTNNGNGTNVKIGDDAWLGDVNIANTIRLQGSQNAANGYIIFGNSNTTALGRAGTGALTYGGNTIWHGGNDGAGSGLDADTLDGVQGASFLRSDTTDSWSGTLSWGASNTHGLSFQNSSYTGNYLYIGGWTSANTNGISRIRNSNANLHLDSGANGNLYLNHYSGGTVYARGQTVWHAGNDGSGSGLDADLLDGLNSGSFLRSDASDVATGPIAWDGTLATFDPPGGGTGTDTATDVAIALETGLRIAGWNDGYIRTLFKWTSGGDIEIGQGGTSLIAGINLLPGSSGVAKVNGNTIWHAGNDGAGSGLDADLLDGKNSSIFLVQQGDIGGDNWNGFIDGTEASWRTVLNHSGSNRPSSSYTYGTALSFAKSGQAKFQLYAPETGSGGNGLWYRTGWNTTYRAWVKIWDSGNDGSGSGLDADLLDGLHSSSFKQNSTTDGNHVYIRNNSPTVYFRDTDHNSAMVHCNSNLLYVLRGATDSTGWSQVNSQWPFIFNLSNNDATCGGNLNVIGNVNSNSSDRRLKENFRQIDNALDKVMSLNGLYFDWKDEVYELGFTPDQKENDAGLIAQEVQNVLPQAVKPAPFDREWDPNLEKNISKSGKEYLTVQYEKVVPLLIEAIKEQQYTINMMNGEIENLKSKLQ